MSIVTHDRQGRVARMELDTMIQSSTTNHAFFYTWVCTINVEMIIVKYLKKNVIDHINFQNKLKTCT